jgi:hypothetical protein
MIRGGPQTVLAALAATLVPAQTAGAAQCLTVGVYQDTPTRQLAPLQSRVGRGVSAVSVYVTAGALVDPALIKLANTKRLVLVVSWLPDNGSDSANQPAYRLSAVIRGKDDASLKRLVKQLRGLKRPAILRPMPEPNTPWFAWGGLVNHNSPRQYIQAWLHLRSVVRRAGGSRIRLLWTPFAESVPQQPSNSVAAYWPGARNVDMVGADDYNFGTVGSQTWRLPADLFVGAYQQIERLAAKPFWIGETGSTAVGGSKSDWITSLSRLPAAMPRLAGLLWFDALDPANGDFRLTTPPVLTAFKGLLRGACR